MDATANFGLNANGRYTVALDAGGDTVGNLNLSGTTAYTIGTTGGPSLTFQVSSGQATISNSDANHTIAAPVKLLSNTTITVLSGSSLILASPLVTSSSTLTVTKAGTGTLQIERIATGTFNIGNGSGTVEVSAKGSPNSRAGTSVLTNLFVGNSGSAFDMTNNAPDRLPTPVAAEPRRRTSFVRCF